MTGPIANLSNLQRLTKPMTDAIGAANLAGDARSQKELAYKTFIVAQESGILIEAWLPEQVGIDIHADYDAPYARGIQDMVSQGLGNFTRFIGMALTTQALTAQIWQGGSTIDITMPLIFQAENSGTNDVMAPIQDLMRLTMPRDPSGGGFLEAPGPRIDLKALAENGKEAATNVINSASSAVGNIAANPGQTMTNMKNDPFGTLSKAQQAANEPARQLSTALINSVKNNISLYVGQFMYLPTVVIVDVSPTYDIVIGIDKNPMRATVNVTFRTFFMPTQNDIETMFPATSVKTENAGRKGR